MSKLIPIVGLCLLLLAGSPAWAERRVALVIGNSRYQHASALDNPQRDATAMAAMFKAAKFDVVIQRADLEIVEFKRTLRTFFDSARTADIAVVYFAGHGIELNGVNYMLPVDAKLTNDLDAEDEAVELGRFVQSVEKAKRLRLIIIDACRNNPFAPRVQRTVAFRAIGTGLGKIELDTPDTLIAYAAKAGSVAEDGTGENSPFAKALIKHLPVPGLDIRLALGRVRDDVLEDTGKKQEPFVYGSLGGKEIPLVPPPEPPPQTDPPKADVRTDYEIAERVGTVAAWQAFLIAHPTGFYSELARAQLAKQKERSKSDTASTDRLEWDKIESTSDPALIDSFLKRFPNSYLYPVARSKLDQLEWRRREELREAERRREAERLQADIRREDDARAKLEAEKRRREQQDADRRTKEARKAEEARLAEEARKTDQARREAERVGAEARKAEQARIEAERKAEDARRRAERKDAERKAEEARREAARMEAERKAAEARKVEDARREAERRDAERRNAERREAERKAEEARREAARIEAERKAAEIREAEDARREAERRNEERKAEEARREAARIEAARAERLRTETQITTAAPNDKTVPAPDAAVDGKPTTLAALVPAGKDQPIVEDPSRRHGLIRKVQEELLRLGCYKGDPDGNLTPSTRQAIETFLSRTGTAKPAETVTEDLLARLKNRTSRVCPIDCPSGQTARGERCVANKPEPTKSSAERAKKDKKRPIERARSERPERTARDSRPAREQHRTARESRSSQPQHGSSGGGSRVLVIGP